MEFSRTGRLFVVLMSVALGLLPMAEHNYSYLVLLHCIRIDSLYSVITERDLMTVIPRYSIVNPSCRTRLSDLVHSENGSLVSFGLSPHDRAFISYVVGNYDETIKIASRHTSDRDMKDLESFWIGNAFFFRGDWENALMQWNRLEHFDKYFVNYAGFFASTGAFDNAKNMYLLGLQVFPSNVELLYDMSGVFWNVDADISDWAIRRLQAIEPPSARLLFTRARGLIAKGDYQGAELLLRQAVQIDENVFRYWQALGFVSLQLAHIDESIEELLRAIQLDSDHPDQGWTWLYLGQAYSLRGDRQAAVDSFLQIPSESPAYYQVQEHLQTLSR